MSACLRRIVGGRRSGPAFRLRLLGHAFAALTKATSLEPIPLIAGAASHVGGCALHPGAHRSGPIAGKKVGGGYTSRERDNGAERTRILILSAQIDVSNPVFGFGPALLNVLPFLTGVLPELGQTLFRPFANLAARLLYVFQAVPYALSEGRQTFPQQLRVLVPG